LSSCELSRTLNLISATFFTEMASFVNANLDSDSDSDDQVRFFLDVYLLDIGNCEKSSLHEPLRNNFVTEIDFFI